MNINKLFVVRHGEYDRGDADKGLSKFGEGQMSKLAAVIKSIIGVETTQVLSSNAVRASESAKILAAELGCTVEPHGFLFSGPDSPYGYKTDLKRALRLMAESPAQTLVLVTHLEYTEQLPIFVAKNVFGDASGFPGSEVGKGEAWFIDLQRKTCAKVTPYS